jgi:hypothetical protein
MSKGANKRGTPRKKKKKNPNKRRPEVMGAGQNPKEIDAALEIMAFTGFFMIESKFAVGRARIIDNKELEESFVTYSRDAQALQYIQYQIMQAYPEICKKIMNDVVGALDKLPAEVRQLFVKEQAAIEEHGKEALRIPEEVIKRLDADGGAKKLTRPGETTKFAEDAAKIVNLDGIPVPEKDAQMWNEGGIVPQSPDDKPVVISPGEIHNYPDYLDEKTAEKIAGLGQTPEPPYCLSG